MAIALYNTQCGVFLLMVLFNNVHGISFSAEPNRTTVALTGFNQTFAWHLSLNAEEKSKELKVQFGPWDKRHSLVKYYLMTIIQEPAGKEIEIRANRSRAKRLHWTGNLTHAHFVAFQLTDVKREDAGDYGIRFRVDGFPPGIKEGWFSLSVKDPPVKPTADTRNITLEVKKGDKLNITCRISLEHVQARSTIVWIKDNIPVRTGQSMFLFIASVNRSQAGNYICVSRSPTGNRTSAITAVNVLYAPSIQRPNKLVSVLLLKGISTRLVCVADGNPSPTFHWHKNSKTISKGFINTWNSSTLTITPTNDDDYGRYVCTARNWVGWDAVTFNLHEKGPQAVGNTKAADGDDTNLVKYLSVSAVLAVFLVCAFLAQRYVAKRYRGRVMRCQDNEPDETRTQSSETAATELINHGENFSGLNPSFSVDIEWEIPREHLKVEKVIGRGAFGVVSRGLALNLPERPGWSVVAVKSIQEDATERERRDLLSEMSVLKQLEPHPHVIRLYGCVSTEARPLVVVEYAQYGDVLGYLRRSRGVSDNYYSDPSVKPCTSLTSKQLLKFAWEISDGMHYLSSKKIIHRDLAARNVLVGEGEVCKITDFGMARDVQEEDIYVRTHEGRLPIKWTAPEALFGSGAYTTASDVWSYGVVLYEIFTVGGDPFPGVYMRDIPALLKNGYRMSRPKFISPKLYEIMMGCWKSDPSHRPSFGCLRSTLHTMMEEEEQEYVNLEELFYENVISSSARRV